jgi:hypothetical protein
MEVLAFSLYVVCQRHRLLVRRQCGIDESHTQAHICPGAMCQGKIGIMSHGSV